MSLRLALLLFQKLSQVAEKSSRLIKYSLSWVKFNVKNKLVNFGSVFFIFESNKCSDEGCSCNKRKPKVNVSSSCNDVGCLSVKKTHLMLKENEDKCKQFI